MAPCCSSWRTDIDVQNTAFSLGLQHFLEEVLLVSPGWCHIFLWRPASMHDGTSHSQESVANRLWPGHLHVMRAFCHRHLGKRSEDICLSKRDSPCFSALVCPCRLCEQRHELGHCWSSTSGDLCAVQLGFPMVFGHEPGYLRSFVPWCLDWFGA